MLDGKWAAHRCAHLKSKQIDNCRCHCCSRYSELKHAPIGTGVWMFYVGWLASSLSAGANIIINAVANILFY